MIQTDRSMSVADLGIEAESRGFDSIWCTEHTHVPASRKSPFPSGGEMPENYYRILDPLVALAAAAQVTSTIQLGTGVCLVAQHDPILLAKQVATLDHLSAGRVVLGVGYGWNLEEVANHGVQPAQRREVAHENLRAMRAIWSNERASFAGDHVQFDDMYMWPKPRTAPPILLGAGGKAGIRAAVEIADGWMPIGGSGLREHLEELHRVADELDRDPAEINVTLTGVRAEPDKIEYYRSLGVDRLVYGLPSSRDSVLRALDRVASIALPAEV